jgi:hypothetical protein
MNHPLRWPDLLVMYVILQTLRRTVVAARPRSWRSRDVPASSVPNPLARSVRAAGGPAGMPLGDDYPEFLEGQCRPNTVLAAAYDLRVFFTVVAKSPQKVRRPTCSGSVFACRRPLPGEACDRCADLAPRSTSLGLDGGSQRRAVLLGDVPRIRGRVCPPSPSRSCRRAPNQPLGCFTSLAAHAHRATNIRPGMCLTTTRHRLSGNFGRAAFADILLTFGSETHQRPPLDNTRNGL